MRRLLIRPGAIGDVLVSFPALAFLKAAYTEVWVPSALVPLVGFADRVQSIASSGIELLGVGDLPPSTQLAEHVRSFDEVISWYGSNRPEFRAALSALNPRTMFHVALPEHVHATDFYAAQVGAPLGLEPRIAVDPLVVHRSIAIHPFSGSAAKNWPLPSFQAMARRLPQPVEWVAGPNAEEYRFPCLADLAQWLAGARLYIGNDSGVMHLAAAVGVPVLALFGPSDPAIWAPRGRHVCVLQRRPLADLSVDEVSAAAHQLLNTA